MKNVYNDYVMKISVIVPFYNVESYFSRCITSILNQSFSDFELILVNDGSTDNSLNIANSFAKNDNRVIVVSQKNAGQASARNHGLKVAKGEYIAFVDSDDWVENYMLERLITVIEAYDADVVQCRFEFDNEYTGAKKEYRRFNVKQLVNHKDIIIDSLLVKNILVSPWAKLFRRSFLIDNNLFFEEGIVNEDTLFTLKFACYVKNIQFINDNLYHAIEREGSTSRGSYLKLCKHMVIALNLAREFYKQHNLYKEVESIFQARYIKSIQYNLLQAAQRLSYQQYSEVWEWNMYNSEYIKLNTYSSRKYLPLINRLFLTILNSRKIFYCSVRLANIFGVKMH